MALVRQLKTAGFRLKSRYNTLVDRLSKVLKLASVSQKTWRGFRLNLFCMSNIHVLAQLTLYNNHALYHLQHKKCLS